MDNKQKCISIIAILLAFMAFSMASSVSSTNNYFNNSTCDNCSINQTSLDSKVNKSGDTMTGNLSMSENSIHDPLYFGNLSNNIYMYFVYDGMFKQIQTIVDNTTIAQTGTYIILSASNSQVKVNNGIEFLYNTVPKFTINSTGTNVLENININNNNITDTNTLTINNGITLYSPTATSNNETYNFTGCTIGTVPTGWSEDTTNGYFRCIAGGIVELIHASANASANNNYHLASSVTTDNNFTIQFNVSSRIASDYSYFVFNDVVPVSTLKGIYLSIHSGNLYYYSGGWNLLQAITVNQTYTIKVNDTKVSTGKFDIYVDGVQKGNDINFAAASSSISYIHFAGGGSENTDEYLDDISINVAPGNSSAPWCVRVALNGTLYTTAGIC